MRATFTALTKGKLVLKTSTQIDQIATYMVDFVTQIKNTIQPYPPVPPPPNRYKRTYNLFRSWEVRKSISPSGIRVSLVSNSSNARYAKYVQGVNQRGYHAAHGWKRLDQYENRGAFNSGIRALFRGIRIDE